MQMDELDATIQMMLYTDQSYTEAYAAAPTIELRDKVGQAPSPIFHLYSCHASSGFKKQS